MLQAFPLYYILNISGPRRDRRGNPDRLSSGRDEPAGPRRDRQRLGSALRADGHARRGEEGVLKADWL